MEEQDNSGNSRTTSPGLESEIQLIDKVRNLAVEMSSGRHWIEIKSPSDANAIYNALKNELNIMRRERDELSSSIDFLVKRHQQEVRALTIERDLAIQQRNEMTEKLNAITAMNGKLAHDKTAEFSVHGRSDEVTKESTQYNALFEELREKSKTSEDDEVSLNEVVTEYEWFVEEMTPETESEVREQT